MMYAVVILMMPWITMSEGSNFQFLAFLAPASIAFVGTAPRFKDSQLESRVHTFQPSSQQLVHLWVALVTPYWWVMLIWLGLIALASVLTSITRLALSIGLSSSISFDIHSSNNVFVMSNTIIKVSEIVSVRHYNTGRTDYLTVALSSGASYKWSCYHYEESASQREKCDDMCMAFGRIKNAIANKMEFVDFYISD